jgi:hypothetical protein
MTLYNRFYAALDKAQRDDVAGARELYSLFVALDDEYEGDELLSKLDAYQCDTSKQAQHLYYAIYRKL